VLQPALAGWLDIGVRAKAPALTPSAWKSEPSPAPFPAAVPPTCVSFGATRADKAIPTYLDTTYAKV
jgi:hypothetical protein